MVVARAKALSENKKQLTKFVLIGGLAVLTDLACYYIFLNLFPADAFGETLDNEAVSKSLSFLCGLSVTYWFNKRWTWRRKDRDTGRLMRFLLIYGISLLLNVGINSGLLHLLHTQAWLAEVPFKYFFAFAGATGSCSVFNFVGQKFWIFRPGEEEI
jgi:putative flippase GtrA